MGTVVIAVTESNNVYALNATNGAIVWQRNARHGRVQAWATSRRLELPERRLLTWHHVHSFSTQ